MKRYLLPNPVECRQKGHPQHLEDQDGRVEGESLEDRVRGVQRGSIHGSEPAPKVAPSPLVKTVEPLRHTDSQTETDYYNVCKQVSESVVELRAWREQVETQYMTLPSHSLSLTLSHTSTSQEIPRHRSQQSR